jgi:hypothetical protein
LTLNKVSIPLFKKVMTTKYNILVLHGKSQNKDVMRSRLGRIPQKCKEFINLMHFAEAPHLLPLVNEDGTEIIIFAFCCVYD